MKFSATPSDVFYEMGASGVRMPDWYRSYFTEGEIAEEEALAAKSRWSKSFWIDVSTCYESRENYVVELFPTDRAWICLMGYVAEFDSDDPAYYNILWDKTVSYWKDKTFFILQLERLKTLPRHPEMDRIKELIGMNLAEQRLLTP